MGGVQSRPLHGVVSSVSGRERMVDKKAWGILASVLVVMVVGFASVILLTNNSEDEVSGPGPLAVACVEAGGEWLGFRCKTAVEIDNQLRERERRDFCMGPQRLRTSEIPERCRDFYAPVTTTIRR